MTTDSDKYSADNPAASLQKPAPERFLGFGKEPTSDAEGAYLGAQLRVVRKVTRLKAKKTSPVPDEGFLGFGKEPTSDAEGAYLGTQLRVVRKVTRPKAKKTSPVPGEGFLGFGKEPTSDAEGAYLGTQLSGARKVTRPKPKKTSPVIFVISDSVGDTAEVLVRAAASQFNTDAVEIRLIPFVSATGEISDIVEEAGCYNSLIVYTLVMPELREALAIEAERHDIPTLDILNPVIDAISGIIQSKPRLEPGLVRKTDKEYYRKVNAVEFAVRCDDGKNAAGITQADLVVLGVSRTSKTPLCMYLAHKRILTANVPLVPEVAPPEELFTLPPQKIIGLSIQPQQLNDIRRERLRSLGIMADANYVSMERINRELAYADGIMKRIGCAVIDVTNKAVEETASKVLEIYYRTNI